jgi:predicted RNA-binding protein
MAELESYSKLLWGERARHNETAEWIRREERKKVSNMGDTRKNCGEQFIFVVSTQL